MPRLSDDAAGGVESAWAPSLQKLIRIGVSSSRSAINPFIPVSPRTAARQRTAQLLPPLRQHLWGRRSEAAVLPHSRIRARCLGEAGRDSPDVIKLTFYIADVARMPAVRLARDRAIYASGPPASSRAGGRAVSPDCLIEMDTSRPGHMSSSASPAARTAVMARATPDTSG